MKSLYTVPVIPNNLRHKETIIQIADALGYVNQVFDDILLRVNNRIKERETHVIALRERISEVHKKVQKLTNTKKATQVFANSKYPANKCNDKYVSLFSSNEKDKSELGLSRTKVKLKEQLTNEQSNSSLQFYHVKIKTDKQDLSGFGRNSSLEGLGRAPANAHLINELLLFNTYKNLYKNYEYSDPFSHDLQANNKYNDESNRQGPDEAPLSMTQRVGSVRESKENYFYSPDLGDVPTIDVPLDLPDLPGVADDLRYLMELGPGIAPSVTTTPVIPELPPVTQFAVPSDIVPLSLPENGMPNIPNIDISVRDLPEPLPELPVQDDNVATFTAMLPELPPEPVVERVSVTQVDSSVEKPSVRPAVMDPSDGIRANLMEAIRQAGTLKKAKLNSVNVEDELQKNKTQGANIGNDLMADLHAKLALRRKGISGTRSADGLSEVNSAMNRVSAMIPPPMLLNNSELVESTATEDDEAEWDE